MMRTTLCATLRLTAVAVCACACALGQAAPAPNSIPAPDVSVSATYDGSSPLASQIAAVLAAPAVARDHWGIQVTTLDGTPIYSLNEAQLFQPASNAKLFTTSAALALLGGETTVETKVEGRGVFDGVASLNGDIAIVGNGDANLSGRVLPYHPAGERTKGSVSAPTPDPLRYIDELADQVAASGLKLVTGDVIGDDTLFPWEPYPSDWSIDDAVWGYGAPVSALTINDNQQQVTVTPSRTPNSSATVTVAPSMPYYTLDVAVSTAPPKSGSHVQMERLPGSKLIRIYGSIAVDASPDIEEIAIQDPAEYAAMALKQALESRGVKVEGLARAQHRSLAESDDFVIQMRRPSQDQAVVSGGIEGGGSCLMTGPLVGKILATHVSPPLQQDLVVTNKVSQNLHAELLLHRLGRRPHCSKGSTAEGAELVRVFLIRAGLSPNDFVFYDGSGLSGHDLVTPRATAKLLQYATSQPWFALWKSSLPIGGEDGTLASRFPRPPLKDHLFAKTGTLGEARALSGYLDAASGRTIIFSIFVGNHLPGTSDDREAMDKIVAAIQATQ